VEAIAVITLFFLRLKAQRPLLALACVVVAFQLILGQASSDVLADRQPPLSVAVQQRNGDVWGDKLVADLNSTVGFEVIEVDPALTPDEVFRRNRVQGLLAVPEDFGANIDAGTRSPVTFFPAPGIMNSDFAREQIANTVVRLRARHALEIALGDRGAGVALTSDTARADLLDVVYEGPALQGDPQDSSPVYGTSALLILLAYLHAALTVPTREDKRLLAHGRRAFIRQSCASMLVVWLVWLVITALYFVLMAVLLGALPGAASGAVQGVPPEALPTLVSSCLGFLAIALYVSLLAAVLAQLLGRQVASWLFLPLFVLNMTIGGGLWGEAALSPALAPLVPVAAVATPGSATLLGTGTLLAAAVLMAAALAALVVARFRASALPRQ
jgi:hypothetical protein